MRYHTIKSTLEARLGPKVAVTVADPRVAPNRLEPVEMAAVSKAVPKRRIEFAAGRAALRQSLAELGHRAVAMPMGPDRAPVYPAGIKGALSHSPEICVALAARQKDFSGIGIDLEPVAPMPHEILSVILNEAERHRLSLLPKATQNLATLRIFSAKECTYKAQYDASGMVFGFDCLDITLTDTGFEARFLMEIPPFAKQTCLKGQSFILENHIVSTMLITAQDQAISQSCPVKTTINA